LRDRLNRLVNGDDDVRQVRRISQPGGTKRNWRASSKDDIYTEFISYPVSKQVNATRNNDPSCVEPRH